MAATRSPAQEPAPSMALQALIMMVFAGLGVLCSTLMFGSPAGVDNSLEASRDSEPVPCPQIQEVARLRPTLRKYMATKLRYQFEGVVTNETEFNGCTATKVYTKHAM